MKIILIWALLVSTTCLAGPIKALTFNTLLLCIGPWCSLASSPKPSSRAEEIGAFLNSRKADFVFLQEVSQERFLKSILSFSDYPYYYFFEPTRTAILSKHPLGQKDGIVFKWQGSYVEDCKRSFVRYFIGQMTAIATLPDGKKVLLALTHTLPRYSELPGFRKKSDELTPERILHVYENLDRLKKRAEPDVPIVFAGDFNMNQKSEAYERFSYASNLVDTYRIALHDELKWKNQCTFCDENEFVKDQGIPGEGILDYIWVSHPQFDVITSEIIQKSGKLSDHLALESTIVLNGKTGSYAYNLPTAQTVRSLENYFQTVSIHPFCWLAPVWSQRSESLRFLTQFRNANEAQGY